MVTNEERDLVFSIAQGNPQILQFIGHLRLISMDAKQVEYMDIIRWMNKNGMRGDTLIGWIDEKQDGSILNAISALRQKAYSDYKKRKIYAKKII
jgi:5,10-methenyltetrahydromethanopterin hydrogenase